MSTQCFAPWLPLSYTSHLLVIHQEDCYFFFGPVIRIDLVASLQRRECTSTYIGLVWLILLIHSRTSVVLGVPIDPKAIWQSEQVIIVLSRPTIVRHVQWERAIYTLSVSLWPCGIFVAWKSVNQTLLEIWGIHCWSQSSVFVFLFRVNTDLTYWS